MAKTFLAMRSGAGDGKVWDEGASPSLNLMHYTLSSGSPTKRSDAQPHSHAPQDLLRQRRTSTLVSEGHVAAAQLLKSPSKGASLYRGAGLRPRSLAGRHPGASPPPATAVARVTRSRAPPLRSLSGALAMIESRGKHPVAPLASSPFPAKKLKPVPHFLLDYPEAGFRASLGLNISPKSPPTLVVRLAEKAPPSPPHTVALPDVAAEAR